MLGKLFTSPLLTSDPSSRVCISSLDAATAAPHVGIVKLKVWRGISAHGHIDEIRARAWSSCAEKKWKLCCTTGSQSVSLSEEEKKRWEACRGALIAFGYSIEEKDKILGKAFGHVHSPYWGEEKEKEVPREEVVDEILEYLRSLGLSDGDVGKVLKKFPEVLGCNLHQEVRSNVQVLEETWGIKGKSLRSLLLRNPKVLGYSVDCKGDCIAKCTRCWVRF